MLNSWRTTDLRIDQFMTKPVDFTPDWITLQRNSVESFATRLTVKNSIQIKQPDFGETVVLKTLMGRRDHPQIFFL